jgi:hypothetical protein
VTQDNYAKPRSGGKALKPNPFGGVQAAEQRRRRRRRRRSFKMFADIIVADTLFECQDIFNVNNRTFINILGRRCPHSLSAPPSVMDNIRTATQSCQDPIGTSSWFLWNKFASLTKPVGSQWEGKPVQQKCHAKVRCAGPKRCKQRTFKTV